MSPRPSLLAVATAVVVAAALSGCLQAVFGESRSDWAYGMTQLDDVSALGRTGKGVTVAIIDTGINIHHPALAHLLDHDRSNGELVAFKDFLGNASTVEQAFDDDGHGSHVAGILAAKGGDKGLGGFDLRGGAPNVLLVVARICAGDACAADQLDDAVTWAAGQGADVISLSLGGQYSITDSVQEKAIQDAVDGAINQGIVVIAAAGNKGPSNTDVESPAIIPGVIAVGAVDRAGRVADFSSRGDDTGNPCRPVTLPIPPLGGRCAPDQKPEIVAPGVDILSAWTGKGYASAAGTSQATPFVTAAVALLLEGHSDLGGRSDVEHLKQVLADTAKAVQGQTEPHDDAAGYGLLQARAALKAYAGA